MKTFRKVLFWLHLISGTLAGIFIFIMCVSGALLSFEPNILDSVEREMRYVAPPATPDAKRLPVGEILTRVKAARPDAEPSGIALKNDKSAAAVVSYGRAGQAFVNPYTGAVTGEGAPGWRSFFRVTEDAHRWLALSGDGRAIGKGLNDAANLLFLFLAITGVYLWFPRNLRLKNFKPVIWFRRGLRGKARNFNWHNVIGFWTSLVLIVLTATGVVISYQWAGNLVYTLTGNDVPPARQAQRSPQNSAQNGKKDDPPLPENLDDLWAKAENHTSWKSISLRLPVEKEAQFTIEEGAYWNKFARSTLSVDAATGEISKWESYGEQNSARQLRSWIRFTHTGETGGLVGQLIGFVACIGGAFLVWTGFSLALRRLRNWRVRENGRIK